MGHSSFGTAQVMRARSEFATLQEADRIRRDRIERDRASRRAELERAATADTVRKLRRDIIVVLMESGDITPEQARAAREILKVYTAIAGAQSIRGSAYGELRGGSDNTDWQPALSRAYRERYCPWRDAMGLKMVRGTTSVASLVFLIACDNMGVRQVADQLRMDQRTVKSVLQQALHAYAEMAGWIETTIPESVCESVRSEIVPIAKMTA